MLTSNFPTGTVTFLFTDIQGSTSLAREYPDAWESMHDRHDSILRDAVESHHGFVFETLGDSFYSAFQKPGEALQAALKAQRNLQNEPWSHSAVRVRIGIHTGEAETDGKDYRGYLTLSLVQRIMSAGHGGQILLSGATEKLLQSQLPDDVTLRNLGEHKLKDTLIPVRIFQVIVPGMQSDFPALRCPDVFPNNLPAHLSSFIGREKEMTEIMEIIQDHRLVTLTGSGGTGKTRLALQVAADLLNHFGYGVWLVELAPLADPDLIPQTILSALGVKEQRGRTPLEILAEYLREKQALIVLDNCEHLVLASAQVTDSLLRSAPGLKILATSREALGVKGELSYPVPSLTVPDLKQLPDIEQLSQYEAVRLFMDRAQLANPHFVLNQDNASFISQVCHRLDGIPLAIELAAARIKMMSVELISTRLDDRFRLLTGGSRTVLPRQQTLRALIDWSYNLLSEPEKILFRRLAVFAGGWTMEAAESVCSSEGIEPEDVLDLLGHLVDKSLVVITSERTESRYRRLETIRHYAREKLAECGESGMVRNRHMKYFCQLVEQFEPGLRGPDQVTMLDNLEIELDNLRAALEWTLDHDISEGLRMAARLKWFWHLHYRWNEGTGWLDKLLSAESEHLSNGSETSSSALDRAKALLALSYLSSMQGEIQKAKVCVEASVALCEKMEGTDGIPLLAESYQNLGVGELLINGNLKQAKLLAEKSLALHQSCGNKFGVAEVQANIFMVIALHSGEFETARLLAESNLAIRQELGDKDGIAYELENGGKVAVCQGDYERAKKLFLAAIEASHEARSDYSLGSALGNLGVAYLFNGELDLALDCFLQVVKVVQEKWHTMHKTGCICWLAMYSFEQKHFRKFILLNSYLERENSLALYLKFFPVVQTILQKNIATARAELGEEIFQQANAEGKAMTLDQAFDYALEGINE